MLFSLLFCRSLIADVDRLIFNLTDASSGGRVTLLIQQPIWPALTRSGSVPVRKVYAYTPVGLCSTILLRIDPARRLVRFVIRTDRADRFFRLTCACARDTARPDIAPPSVAEFAVNGSSETRACVWLSLRYHGNAVHKSSLVHITRGALLPSGDQSFIRRRTG